MLRAARSYLRASGDHEQQTSSSDDIQDDDIEYFPGMAGPSSMHGVPRQTQQNGFPRRQHSEPSAQHTQQSAKCHAVPTKASVVALENHMPNGIPLKPVGDHASKAAADIFSACDRRRSGTLRRREFATAVEMMMREKLVPYLIEQVRTLSFTA